MIKDLFRFRRYLLGSFVTEIRYEYAGTVLGLFWFIVNPLVELAIYTIVFSQIIELRSSGSRDISYVYFLMTGLFPWFVFSRMVLKGSNSLIRNSIYLRRLAIPPSIFVAKEALVSLFTLFIYSLLLVPISISVVGEIRPSLLALPLIGILLVAMAYGLTLTLAHIKVLFPDTGEIVSAGVHLWRWTLPIMFSITILPEAIRGYFELNPPHFLIDSYHVILIDGQFPSATAWIHSLIWTAVFLLIGSTISARLEDHVKEAL